MKDTVVIEFDSVEMANAFALWLDEAADDIIQQFKDHPNYQHAIDAGADEFDSLYVTFDEGDDFSTLHIVTLE